MTEDEMVGWHHRPNEFEQAHGGGEGQGSLAWGSPGDSQESSLTPQFKSISSSGLSFLYSSTLTSVHDYWKNHSLDYMDLGRQSDVFAF